jgi:hypothetical protein
VVCFLAVDACVFALRRWLCPPLDNELYVGTIIHTVPTSLTYHTKVRFPNVALLCKEFFSRARDERTFFFANNNM